MQCEKTTTHISQKHNQLRCCISEIPLYLLIGIKSSLDVLGSSTLTVLPRADTNVCTDCHYKKIKIIKSAFGSSDHRLESK